MDPKEQGIKLARDMRWGIEDIGAAIMAALEEANCHELANGFAKLLDHEIYGARE